MVVCGAWGAAVRGGWGGFRVGVHVWGGGGARSDLLAGGGWGSEPVRGAGWGGNVAWRVHGRAFVGRWGGGCAGVEREGRGGSW